MRSLVLYSAVWLSGVSLTSLSHASESEDIPKQSFDTHPFNVDTFGVMASFIPGKDWDFVIQVNRGFRHAFQAYLESVIHQSLPTSLFHTCSEDAVMHRMLSIPGSWLCSMPNNPDVMQYVPNMPAEIVKAPIQAGRVRLSNTWLAFNTRRRDLSVCSSSDPSRRTYLKDSKTERTLHYPGTESMDKVEWLNQDLFVAFRADGCGLACVGSADSFERGLCWIQVDSEEEAQPFAEQSKVSFYQLISEGWLPGYDYGSQWAHLRSKLIASVKPH